MMVCVEVVSSETSDLRWQKYEDRSGDTLLLITFGQYYIPLSHSLILTMLTYSYAQLYKTHNTWSPIGEGLKKSEKSRNGFSYEQQLPPSKIGIGIFVKFMFY